MFEKLFECLGIGKDWIYINFFWVGNIVVVFVFLVLIEVWCLGWIVFGFWVFLGVVGVGVIGGVYVLCWMMVWF